MRLQQLKKFQLRTTDVVNAVEAAAALLGMTPEAVTLCPLGWSLVFGQHDRLSGSAPVCRPCPAGSYASAPAGMAMCIPCASGTSSEAVAAKTSAVCVPCPFGSYASTLGSTNCTQCPANYFCARGSTWAYASRSAFQELASPIAYTNSVSLGAHWSGYEPAQAEKLRFETNSFLAQTHVDDDDANITVMLMFAGSPITCNGRGLRLSGYIRLHDALGDIVTARSLPSVRCINLTEARALFSIGIPLQNLIHARAEHTNPAPATSLTLSLKVAAENAGAVFTPALSFAIKMPHHDGFERTTVSQTAFATNVTVITGMCKVVVRLTAIQDPSNGERHPPLCCSATLVGSRILQQERPKSSLTFSVKFILSSESQW